MRMRNLFVFGLLAILFLMVMSPATASASTLTYDTLLGGPGFYNGTGNPDGHFTTLTDGGLRLSLRIGERFVGPITPTGSNYVAPTGAGAGGYAKWNAEFDVMTSTSVSDFTYLLTFANTSNLTSFSFDPTLIPDNSYWNGVSKSVGLFGPNSSALGMENSENLSWFLAGFDPAALDAYAVTLQATDKATGQVSSVSVTVNGTTTSVPEPASLSLVGIGLFGLMVKSRRRR